VPWYQAFGTGVLGALVVYLALYRETRIRTFLREPRKHWNMLVFDLVVYIFCAGCVTLFLVDPKTSKEAFIGGAAWEGVVAGSLAGVELQRLKRRIKTYQSPSLESTGSELEGIHNKKRGSSNTR
jgi:hypothetical protein